MQAGRSACRRTISGWLIAYEERDWNQAQAAGRAGAGRGRGAGPAHRIGPRRQDRPAAGRLGARGHAHAGAIRSGRGADPAPGRGTRGDQRQLLLAFHVARRPAARADRGVEATCHPARDRNRRKRVHVPAGKNPPDRFHRDQLAHRRIRRRHRTGGAQLGPHESRRAQRRGRRRQAAADLPGQVVRRDGLAGRSGTAGLPALQFFDRVAPDLRLSRDAEVGDAPGRARHHFFRLPSSSPRRRAFEIRHGPGIFGRQSIDDVRRRRDVGDRAHALAGTPDIAPCLGLAAVSPLAE